MIFDTANPTGGDSDLETSNLGSALIISEDGDSSDPDDNAGGGTLSIAFDTETSVESLTFLDNEEGAMVRFYDESGTLLGEQWVDGTGDNSQNVVEFNMDGVYLMEIELCGSVAIDDLVFNSATDNLDGTVEGTAGDDLIDSNYAGDPDGDFVDNDDAILAGDFGNDDLIVAGAGNDVVFAGDGDDEVYGGTGDDSITGGSGNDVIYGDANGAVETVAAERESFGWEGLSDSEIDGGIVVDTGSVIVTYDRIQDTGDHFTNLSSADLNTTGIESGTQTVDDNSSLYSETHGHGNEGAFSWDFSESVDNVSFNINDIDGDGVVRATAFDADGNPIQVILTGGDSLTLLDTDTVAGADTADSEGGYADPNTANYNLNVSIPGPVSRIVVEHDQDGANNSGINITEIFFDSTDGTTGGTGVDGNDVIAGGTGQDLVFGEGGDDTITGGADDDTVYGGLGDDSIDGGTGNDFLLGGDGNDNIAGGDGDDTLCGQDGDDTLFGGAGNDILEGMNDNDVLFGGTGDDRIYADAGDDVANGGAGNDSIYGGSGDDTVSGGAGDDSILGGAGNDTLRGDGEAVCNDEEEDYFPEHVQDISNMVFYYDTDGDGVIDYSVKVDNFPDGGSGTWISNDADAFYNQMNTWVIGQNPDLAGATVTVGVSLKGGSIEPTEFYAIDGNVNGTASDTGPTMNTGSGNTSVLEYQDFYPTYDPALSGDTGGTPATGTYDDSISGGAGDDTIFGECGDDTLSGDAGNDIVYGGADRDVILGGAGDTVDGGAGGDDYDILDLTGQGTFILTGPDGTGDPIPDSNGNGIDGQVVFVDQDGVPTGETINFTEIEEIIGDEANMAPDATDDSFDGLEDTATAPIGNVITGDTGNGTDTDPDGDTLTVSAVDGAGGNVGTPVEGSNGGLITILEDGTASFDPNGNFEALGEGETSTTSVSYTVEDGNGGTDTATVTITVTGTNDAPVATNNAYTVAANDVAGDVDGNVVTDDTGEGVNSDPESDPLTVTQVNGVEGNVGAPVVGDNGGLITVNPDGTVDFDPNGEFDALDAGETATTSVTYTVDDGNGGTDTATVTFTVDGVNDGPVATDNVYAVTYDEAAGDVDGNVITDDTGADVDSDPENDALTVSAVDGIDANVGQPVGGDNGGLFTINADGTVDFDANGDFDDLGLGATNETSVTYTIVDQAGNEDTATATFVVSGINDGTVQGTGGNDIITPDIPYVDADGDIVDANDAILPGDVANDDLILGFGGDDSIDAGTGDDVVFGGTGNDTIEGGVGNDQLMGNDGNDTITGGEGDDMLFGADGDDSLAGNAGNDKIEGSSGNDSITGGGGDDSIDGGTGDDSINAGTGNDVVAGGDGNDIINTGNHIDPAIDYDYLGTDPSENDQFPDNDLDTVFGGAGDDIITTGDDDDSIDGGAGNDFIDAGIDDDSVTGGTGNDTIIGSQGEDIIAGNEGDDVIYGGLSTEVLNLPDAIDSAPDDNRDTIYGGTGNDTIFGRDDADTIFGGVGNDVLDGGIDDDLINGEDGDDTIFGGQGNDVINGGEGQDLIYGGLGDDTIQGNLDDDTIYGDEGNDTITGSLTNDLVFGGTGDDEIRGGTGDDTLYGDDGNDFVQGGYGDDSITGGAGDDSLNGGFGNDVIAGNDGSDTIAGFDGNDTIDAGDNNDLVYGGRGDDSILGGAGDDTIQGGDGNDTIQGGDGKDVIFGGAGNDIIAGNTGDDTIYGGTGEDTITGSIEDDLIFGGADDDEIRGGTGNDTFNGDAGNDYIQGGYGDDILMGDTGDDSLNGVYGNDIVEGGDGNDIIAGFDGEDILTGGDGVDTVYGGLGSDTILGGNGGDVVKGGEDPDNSDIDVLDLTGSNVDFITYVDGDPEAGTVNFLDGTTMTFSEIENVIPCFTPGTTIATAKGERLVEELTVGDRIITRDNGIQEIAWVGHKEMSGKQLVQNPHLKPILIKAGALGNGLPERDMMVSPNHRVLVASDLTQLYFEENEVLAAAKHMVGSNGIHAINVMQTTYVHFMFERHEVVLSNGAWTESFQPGDYSLKGIGNSQRNEIMEIFPELATKTGLKGYQSARKALKKHEAKLLLK